MTDDADQWDAYERGEANEMLHDDHKRELDAVYDERNRCVAAMAAMAQRLGWPAWLGHHEPANDPSWDAEWRNVVYIFLPTEGQVSWHIHDRDLPLFAHLHRVRGVDGTWDGHTTEEKYKRLERFANPHDEEDPVP